VKILVVGPDSVERERVVASLLDVGYAVQIAERLDRAASLVELERPHVVLLGLELPFARCVEGIRQLRAISGSGAYIYLAMYCQELTDAQLMLSYEAGIDYHLSAPIDCLYLHGCLLAAARVTGAGDVTGGLRVRAEGSQAVLAVPAGGSPLSRPAASSSVPFEVEPTIAVAGAPEVLGVPVGTEIYGSPAWNGLPNEIMMAMSTFLGLSVEESSSNEAIVPELVTGISLTNTDHGFELRMSVGVDRDSAIALSEQVCGEGDVELATDVLREVANLVMGTVKTTLGKNSGAYAAGLPVVLTSEGLASFGGACRYHHAFVAAVGGARIAVRCGIVTSTRNAKLAVASLGEGMVLASDIHGSRGMMLVRRGTRLSASVVEKIRRALPGTRMVDVAALQSAS